MTVARALAVLGGALLALAGCGSPREDARTTTQRASDTLVGIAEQRWAMFSDPRFAALGVDHVRLVTAYDTTRVDFERGIVDTWLAQARRTGSEPLIAFGHSRVKPDRLPTVAEFRATFREFRARYPDVRLYAPWNEPNHADQPTRRSPRRAAQFYDVVREECPSCTVLAGELIDDPGMRRYLRAYRRELDDEPAIWGLHNYADANRFGSAGLRALLAAVPGDVWLTETGGLVRFGSRFVFDRRRAARAIEHVLALARAQPRVKRIYIYNWTGAQPDADFDSGLTGPDGSTRPGYVALRAALDGER